MPARSLWCTLIVVLALFSPAVRADNDKLAIIIDDLGYSIDRGRRALSLPGPLTVAVLPFAPHAEQVAAMAQAANVDVIIHQPMQSIASQTNEAGTLTTDMSAEDLRASLSRALDAVPNAVGINNHTGSLLTTYRDAMGALMSEVGQRGLFFVDSRTTRHTVALDVALDRGVPATKRDVFLDHVINRTAIEQQFSRALSIARRQGHAVIIAHPHDLSLRFLEQVLPTIGEYGVVSVRVASLTRHGKGI